MTVRLLVDFKDPADGKQYVVGNLYTSAANEAGLIATKQATSDLTGGTAWVDPVVPESIDETKGVNVVLNASGNTVLVGADGNSIYPMNLVGVALIKTTTETLVPSGVNTKVLCDFADIDDLGIHDAINGVLEIPAYVNRIRVTGSVEYWKESTGFGSALGNYRRVSVEKYPSGILIGCTPLVMPPSAIAAIGVNVATTSGIIKFDEATVPVGTRGLKLMAIQDSGVDCKVGGSGGGQTYLCVEMYI